MHLGSPPLCCSTPGRSISTSRRQLRSLEPCPRAATLRLTPRWQTQMPPKAKATDDENDLKAQVLALQEQLASLQKRNTTPERDNTVLNQARLPPIPLIDPKLNGKLTYRTWSIAIEAVAQSIEYIWEIIRDGTKVNAPASHQQYARSLLLLNMVPNLQMETRHKASAHEIWIYWKEQFEANEFTDLTMRVRRLRNIQWNQKDDIEEFYQEFKGTQMTVQEVSGQPLPDLVLISLLLCAIDKHYSDFVSSVEIQRPQQLRKPSSISSDDFEPNTTERRHETKRNVKMR